MNKYLTAILCMLLAGNHSFAQMDAPASAVTTVQPKIMVIPYTKEGEDIRTVLEADVNKRIVLTKIKEAFDLRHVSKLPEIMPSLPPTTRPT